ncbi:zinc-dependent alcohol dehydrogenase family protein [Gordonia hydrophobica]|uniref:Zinc-binding dehydrogenase n=1 Tax=Gordonia hydrophobica TaxID=40516 RepID=A0ABZ2U6F9_9ACTN|nr:zinc-binding dehydrogenase [Gordonia hydrophobica]MBM7365408.1 2-desacetyl-2-hydroxyethyl bacteriochlorophyllide A dehydrogenase [Gordonia hydrophobica]
MKGIVFTGDKGVEVRDFEVPSPGPGEVIVKIRASGMCGSDLHVYRGAAVKPSAELLVQGHEPCGEIVQVGAGVSAATAKVGDRVMIHHYWGCGTCIDCRTGWPQMCRTAEPRVPTLNEHGAHAEYMRIPAIQTMPLPDSLSYAAGAAIGCGTGTAWGALLRLGDISGKTIAVFGQGPVGLSATMFAASLGARVIAVDIAQGRLDQARAFGADVVVNSAEVDAVEAIRAATAGRGPELVLETSGVTRVAQQALDVAAPWGRICFIGIGADIAFNTKDTLRRQLTIVTSWTMSTVEQMRCAEYVDRMKLPVEDLFSHRWTLDQAVEAYEWFDRQDAGKGVFEAV